MDKHDKDTHFGYRRIPEGQKQQLVANVFSSVADKYDLMNDFMSFGLHRLWKRRALFEANVRPGQNVLDVAAGTGDLTLAMAQKVGPNGYVIMSDINEDMLKQGRERLTDKGFVSNIHYLLADAESLPCHLNTFDCITFAFGLRNVTHKERALRSCFEALRPGGKLLVLEFSHPSLPLLSKLYDLYSFNIIPKLGEWVANDKESYQYLVESIRMHPKQETLKEMFESAGFEDVRYINLSGGIVSLHIGHKY